MKVLLKIFLGTCLALSISAQAQQQRQQQQRVRTTTTAPRPVNYSFASNTENEFVISASKIGIESYKYSKSRTDITAYGAYNYHIKDQIQIGGEGGIIPGTDTKGNSKALLALMGVFTYNFDSNLREAFFVQAGVGLYPSYVKKDGDFDPKISFLAGVGKRIEMWGKINYMPNLRIWKRGDENTRFDLELLNFSIFF